MLFGQAWRGVGRSLADLSAAPVFIRPFGSVTPGLTQPMATLCPSPHSSGPLCGPIPVRLILTIPFVRRTHSTESREGERASYQTERERSRDRERGKKLLCGRMKGQKKERDVMGCFLMLFFKDVEWPAFSVKCQCLIMWGVMKAVHLTLRHQTEFM